MEKITDTQYRASDKKILRRKSDGFVAGKTIDLGYTYYIGGKKLSEPKLETIDDYEEIDDNSEEQHTIYK